MDEGNKYLDKYIEESFPFREVYRTKTEKDQHLQIMEDELTHGRSLFIDGKCQFNTGDSYIYHECMAVLTSLYCKSAPKNALILGGGDGLCAAELLKLGVEDITVCDIDPEVTRLCVAQFPECESAMLDDRVHIYYQDAFEYVRSNKNKTSYDLIIADYTDPESTYFCQRLYTAEHINDIKKILYSTGAFAIQVVSPSINPLAFWCIARTIGAVFPAAHITPLRYFMHKVLSQQGQIIVSKSGKPQRRPPEFCKYLSNSAILHVTSLTKDEYDLDIIDYVPVSTTDNFAYFNFLVTTYSRFIDGGENHAT